MLNKSWSCIVIIPIMILFSLSFFIAIDTLINNPSQAEQISKPIDNYLTYQNDTFSFKLDYPSTWTVAESNPDLFFRVKDVVVNFFSPPETYSDIYSENLNVVVSKGGDTEPPSLDDLLNAATLPLKQIFGIHGTITSQDLTLDGIPAKKITYSYKMFDKDLQNTQIFLIKSGKVYVITYGCNPITCPVYLPIFEKMVQSFRFI